MTTPAFSATEAAELNAYENGQLADKYIENIVPIMTPKQIQLELPASKQIVDRVFDSREFVRDIVNGDDDRILFVVGPCSVHDIDGAKEYGERLVDLANESEIKKRLVVVMRVYVEKPRSADDWEGFVSDPFLDESYDLEQGVRLSRKLFIDLSRIGLPTATEVLHPNPIQYYGNTVSLGVLGARTTESQTHRDVTSGLSMPVGFKNGTNGSWGVVAGAMKRASGRQRFFSQNLDAVTSKVMTRGDLKEPGMFFGISRGSDKGPNFDEASIAKAMEELRSQNLQDRLMVDASHKNCSGDYRKQPEVIREVVRQRREGNKKLIGIMAESYIKAGKQKFPTCQAEIAKLDKYTSITDACIDWETTRDVIRWTAKNV